MSNGTLEKENNKLIKKTQQTHRFFYLLTSSSVTSDESSYNKKLKVEADILVSKGNLEKKLDELTKKTH